MARCDARLRLKVIAKYLSLRKSDWGQANRLFTLSFSNLIFTNHHFYIWIATFGIFNSTKPHFQLLSDQNTLGPATAGNGIHLIRSGYICCLHMNSFMHFCLFLTLTFRLLKIVKLFQNFLALCRHVRHVKLLSSTHFLVRFLGL